LEKNKIKITPFDIYRDIWSSVKITVMKSMGLDEVAASGFANRLAVMNTWNEYNNVMYNKPTLTIKNETEFKDEFLGEKVWDKIKINEDTGLYKVTFKHNDNFILAYDIGFGWMVSASDLNSYKYL